MSHVLRITDGTTTVTLTSGDMYLAEYTPVTAYDFSKPVKEQARVGFTNTIATITDNIRAINRLFYQAASYQRNKTGAKVYVEFDPGSSGTAWRSLLYNGVLHTPEDLLGGMWAAANVECDLEWSRQPYWEGALTQLQLSNASDTDDLDGLAVNNRNDAGGENWVSIKASGVEGDLPAPVKIQMVNATTDGTAIDEVFIFHNVYSTPASFTHVWEAEGSVTTDAATTDATASGGEYRTYTWASTDATYLDSWALTSTDLSYAKGGKFAILPRWNGLFPLSDCWLHFTLGTSSTDNSIWTGNVSLVSTTTDGREITMMDTLRLPPYLEGQATIAGLYLTLWATRDSTDSSIALDYLMLAPISGDSGWLRFKSGSSGIPADETFIHDGTEGINYHRDGSGKDIAEFAQYGGPILLVPNALQRLYFLTCDSAGYSRVTQNWTIKVWYRPRRWAL